MSTIPGNSSWADAGLVPPDSSAVPEAERATVPIDGVPIDGVPIDGVPDSPEPADRELVDPEHEPVPPRPDLRDEADETDVLEQALDVPLDIEDYPEA